MKKVLKIFLFFLIGDIFGCFCMYYLCKYGLSEYNTGLGIYFASPNNKYVIDIMRFDPTVLRRKDGNLTKIYQSDTTILTYFSQGGYLFLPDERIKKEWSKDGNLFKVFFPDRFNNQDVTMIFSYNLTNKNWTLEKTTPLKIFKQSEKK